MNELKYRRILYVIVLVILATIGIQSYWNYKNYLTNKQQLINDVQISLDNAVDDYYTSLAERSTYQYSFKEGEISENMIINGDTIYDHLFQDFNVIEHKSRHDTLNTGKINHLAIFQAEGKDTVLTFENGFVTKEEWIGDANFLKTIKSFDVDSLGKKDFEMLTAKIIFRISNDTINIKRIKELLEEELKRKNIVVDYNLSILNKFDDFEDVNFKNNNPTELTVESKSSFLPHGSKLKMYFTNVASTILKRILMGILISTLLVFGVIACLFYLLKIISHQKQLSEVKNDLISNITHEFKTPIATIGVALESIMDFNVIEDKDKTKRYVNMSINQLSKLNIMVEKLLETATLDSDNLVLNKEKINVTELVEGIVAKYQISIQEKVLKFIDAPDLIYANIDIFYFENAINNIIDNAIKYGGNVITVTLKVSDNTFEVLVLDNGTSLEKTHKEKLFEKFYRAPKGNRHDVKGFGIGLYYTKKIIEKHNGIIQLELNKNNTIFKIALPYE
ncbi:MAG: two-component sensor histidine kinase [Kordia sp.]|nr:MAG: two-component sensor histidine kinase [Kordia sp.]